jgi:hypothetical protein
VRPVRRARAAEAGGIQADRLDEILTGEVPDRVVSMPAARGHYRSIRRDGQL